MAGLNDIPATTAEAQQQSIQALVDGGINRESAEIIYTQGIKPTLDPLLNDYYNSSVLTQAFPILNLSQFKEIMDRRNLMMDEEKAEFIKLGNENPEIVAQVINSELSDLDGFDQKTLADPSYLLNKIREQAQSFQPSIAQQPSIQPTATSVTSKTPSEPMTITVAGAANTNTSLNLPKGVTQESVATLEHLLAKSGPEGSIEITNKINELAKSDPEAAVQVINLLNRGEINHSFIHNASDSAAGVAFFDRQLSLSMAALTDLRNGRISNLDKNRLISDNSYFESALTSTMSLAVKGFTDENLAAQALTVLTDAQNNTSDPSPFAEALMARLGPYHPDPKKTPEQNAAAEANHNEQRADALIGLQILAQSEVGKPDNMLQMAFRQMLDGKVPEGSTPEEHAKSQVGQLMSLVGDENRLIHILDEVDALRDQRRMNGESPLTMEEWTATAQNAGVDYMIMSAATTAAGFNDGHPSTRDAILSNMRREYARIMMAMDSFSAVGSDPNATFLDQIQVALQPYNGAYNPEQLYASSFRAVYTPDMDVAASLRAQGINPQGVDITAMANSDMRSVSFMTGAQIARTGANASNNGPAWDGLDVA